MRERNRLAEERERRLLELATEKGRLRSIVEAMRDGVIVTNREDRVVLHNAAAAALTGCSMSGTEPMPLSDCAYPPALVALIENADSNPEVELRSQEIPFGPEAHQVVGKLTTTFIPAGAVIYRPYAVPPAAFRYVDDPALEVLSFPVDPNKAVGGQVRIGQRVNVWRIVRGQPQGLSATAALSTSLAASELLLPDVLVVDVRSSRGEPVGQPVGESELESQAQRGSQTVPLTILTVALPITETQKLVTLMGEVHLNADVWVSLAAPSTGEEARP
ncbi:MAG: PAS domain-containing protein [Chloroflexi bacterium]|nr:PAS domain-containing protein [Chloroflexota bacterium]